MNNLSLNNMANMDDMINVLEAIANTIAMNTQSECQVLVYYEQEGYPDSVQIGCPRGLVGVVYVEETDSFELQSPDGANIEVTRMTLEHVYRLWRILAEKTVDGWIQK